MFPKAAKTITVDLQFCIFILKKYLTKARKHDML